MKKLNSRGNRKTLALLIALVAMAAVPAGATAGPGTTGHAPAWPETSAPPGETPTLVNQAGAPESGTSSQLPVGVALLGLGLFILAAGVAREDRKRRRSNARYVDRLRALRPHAQPQMHS